MFHGIKKKILWVLLESSILCLCGCHCTGVMRSLGQMQSCLLLEACRWLWKINTSVVLEGRQFLSSVTEVHSLTVAQGAYLWKWNISTDLCSAVVLHAITGLESVNCGYLITRSQTHTHLDSHSPNTFTHILTDTEAYTCTCAISCTHVVLVPQLCSTPWDPMDLPGSSVHGILQARILEWVSIPFSSTHINTYTHPFPTGRARWPGTVHHYHLHIEALRVETLPS